MSTITETSDSHLLDLLRSQGPLGISELVAETEVTATAVRQRLSRLIGQGLIERTAVRQSRGRPGHRYSLTEKGRRQGGSNFADLAIVLWNEIRAVKEPEVRRGLLGRISAALGAMYAGQVQGATVSDRMRSVAELFADRGVPIHAESTKEFPVLTVVQCPYPELAEQDRGICAAEKMLFSQLLNHDVHLAQCRLDGHSCCEFSAS